MKKNLLKFNITFVLTLLAIWIFLPSFCPHLSKICDFTFYRMQVGVYNTIKNTVNAQDENNRHVAITFDDGFACVYKYAKPVLDKYDYTASIAVIGNRIGKYKYLDYKQLSILYKNGYEMLNHSFSHIQNVELSAEKMTQEYTHNRAILNLCGFRGSSDIIITPGGEYLDSHINIAKENNFAAVRSLSNLYVTTDYDNIPVMIINISGKMTIDDIMYLIDEAHTNNQDIILVFHKVIDNPPNKDMYVSTEKFEEIISFLYENNYSTISYKDLIAAN